jgi:hypothetical protein
MNTLGSMTDEESRKLGVSDYERRFLVRVDDAKHNMSPPAEYAQWFRLVSVNLGNGTNMYPDGDDVQALEPWSPPKTCDGFTWAKVDTILTGIDSGLDNGRLYALGKQSKDRWAGDVIMDQTGWAKERVALILKEWKSVGVFKEATYTLSDGPRKGCREGGVKVNWDVIADAKRASSDIVSFIKPTGNGFTEEDAFGIPTDDDDDDDGMDEAA